MQIYKTFVDSNKKNSYIFKNCKIMSRIEELKKQNPNLSINVIDIINEILSKSKYTEMSVNLIKNKFDTKDNNKKHIIDELVNEYQLNRQLLDEKEYLEVMNIYKVLSDYFGYSNAQTLFKFIELNEKKLIINNDLSTYKTFDELDLQISLAELRGIDKEMEKQCLKLMENDEWLVLKPLSYLASLKYGSSTKWCTAMKDNPDYYFRYTKRGILIYVINKKTGNKVAGFKSLDDSYEEETSFWNILDKRIDSLEAGLPHEIMDIFKDEFANNKVTNWNLLSDDETNRQLLWLENQYEKKSLRLIDEETIPIPVENEVAVRAGGRIIPMIRNTEENGIQQQIDNHERIHRQFEDEIGQA
jgi:hypothetical protein